jgi:hypothetical protein
MIRARFHFAGEAWPGLRLYFEGWFGILDGGILQWLRRGRRLRVLGKHWSDDRRGETKTQAADELSTAEFVFIVRHVLLSSC